VQDELASHVEPLRGAVPIPRETGFTSASSTPPGWTDTRRSSRRAEREPGITVKPADAWALMYTSGTTGKPKGAIRNHEGLALISLVTALDMGLSCEDTALLVMPMCHANSLYFGCTFAYIGATVVVDDRKHFDPEALLSTIASQRITFTSLVPTHFIMALGLSAEVKARYDVSRIRKLMISSAPARKDTKLAILDYFRNSQLYELYGSTEAGWVTLLRPDEQIAHLGSVGREWTGSCPVKILDPEGNEVPDGEVGELFSCTPYTFDGYLDDPVKTAEALRAGGYCSVGDLARRDEKGFIHLVDRKSNMIISGGENIYPSEIENMLGRYPGIKDVAVIGVPHEKWGEAVHAVIVMHDGRTTGEKDVLEWCRDKVAGYKRPRSVSFIAESEMPRTATGKIQHRLLRDRFGKGKA
jgi:acyl-CoA synthetase (AMP-forming)/AMP-acid ligase II